MWPFRRRKKMEDKYHLFTVENGLIRHQHFHHAHEVEKYLKDNESDLDYIYMVKGKLIPLERVVTTTYKVNE